MSDDLIGRKALLKELREIMDEPHNTMFLMGIGAAVSIIEHRETAFDKEKVIEELKSNMGSAQLAQLLAGTDLVQCGGFSYGYYNGTKDAIEIIEKGGIE